MGLKIQIASDLHLANWGTAEGFGWFQRFLDEIQTDADVLVLAGDIVSLSARDISWSVARLTEFGVRWPNVVFIPGNHEFYNTSMEDGWARLLDKEPMIPGLYVLRTGRVVEIKGQRFLGDTGWQPELKDGEFAAPINDHRVITDYVTEAPRRHHEFVGFLDQELRSGDILVTHHAPSNKSLDRQWVGDPCNRYFITPEFERFFHGPRAPRLAIHGHVHSTWRYTVGGTEVIANPQGYPGEGVRFNPKMVVEIAG